MKFDRLNAFLEVILLMHIIPQNQIFQDYIHYVNFPASQVIDNIYWES